MNDGLFTKNSFQANVIFSILNDSIQQITLNKEKEPISFVSKQLKMVSQEQLMDHFYNKPAERYLEIRILTPMSFKRYGRYINYPDLRLIYQSLMNKYDYLINQLIAL